MTTPLPDEERQPRDTAYWAEEASVFKVERAPTGALNLNVEGHEVLSPLQGFGQLWQKVYQARVKNATVAPGEIVSVWKQNFPQFWPKGNRFYAPPKLDGTLHHLCAGAIDCYLHRQTHAVVAGQEHLAERRYSHCHLYDVISAALDTR